MKTGSAAEKKNLMGTETKPRLKRARKLPRPTRVTWCRECHKIGIRWDQKQLVDGTCRYCKTGEVWMKRFTSLGQANRFIKRFSESRQCAESDGQERNRNRIGV